MTRCVLRTRFLAVALGGSLILMFLIAVQVQAADYGRVSGTVTDVKGNPLMGATVLVVFAGGPITQGLHGFEVVERVLTDERGKFTVEHLVPGRYSVQVAAATRLAVLRESVHVEAGQTSLQNFVLADIFAPFRFQKPPPRVSTWGEDWKWVLRTSATTRPVLRYVDSTTQDRKTAKASKPALAAQRLIGILPGSNLSEPLKGDAGMGSVLAYLRPLSDDADLLVAGSMAATGSDASSLATVFRNNILKGDPQELVVVVHQLSFTEGEPVPSGPSRGDPTGARGIMVSYSQTRQLSSSVSLTVGMDTDYLYAARSAAVARPRARLEYQVGPSSVLAFGVGIVPAQSEGTLLDRVGEINAFPRVTLSNHRPQLENANHAEVSFSRKVGRSTRVEAAAYHDRFQNAVVEGFGRSKAWGWLGGYALPNPVTGGVNLDAGNYHSSGFRAAVTHRVGSYVETGFLYASGDALAVEAGRLRPLAPDRGLHAFLRPDHSQTLAGKLSARIPAAKTQVTTSYEWVQRGRVTGVDPYGQAGLQLQPYLGVEIRQPLPTLAFLPAHIEALADFRNLLAQGYAPLAKSGDERLILAQASRSFRGGFSVQF